MRLLIGLFAAVLACVPAQASVCGAEAPQASWRVDHYVYDAALGRDWEVLVDCTHPDAPARIELAPAGKRHAGEAATRNPQGIRQKAVGRDSANRPSAVSVGIKAGAAVEVSSAANAPASILLSGTALQTALSGQVIRVRLKPSGRFVTGVVRGPHSVELVMAVKTFWEKP